MIRKSYVRGVVKALSDTGVVKFASEELAAEAADSVAEQMPEQPVGEVEPELTTEIATVLVDLSNQLGEAASTAAQVAEVVAGGEGAPAEGAMPPEAAMPAAASPAEGAMPPGVPEEEKAASIKQAAAVFLKKLAAGATGSTITGDKADQQNTQSQAAGETGEGAMDTQQRPVNFANVGEDGVGNQEASGDGAVGAEKKVDGVGMGNVGSEGTNSVTDAVKSAAALREHVKQAMGGTTITGNRPDQQNTASAAAAVTTEGAMEANMRPLGFASKGEAGVGQSDQQAAEVASAVGIESAHPGSMGHVGQQGTNSAIKQTPGQGAVGKTAAEKENDEWVTRFKTTSAKYASAIPFWLTTNQKIATVQCFMGMSPNEANAAVSHMQKTAELPEGLKEYVAKNGGEGSVEKQAAENNTAGAAAVATGTEKNASVGVGGLITQLRNLHA